jgi:hypothetical protein
MKKVIVVMVIMAMFSTTVFAAPLSAAGSLDKTSLEGFRSDNDFDDLFADVNAVALTIEEVQNVEGEGFWGGLLCSVAFGIAGAFGGGNTFSWLQINSGNNPSDVPASTVIGSIGGGIAGARFGAWLGFNFFPF